MLMMQLALAVVVFCICFAMMAVMALLVDTRIRLRDLEALMGRIGGRDGRV